MNALLTPLAVVILAGYLFIESFENINKTGDIIITSVALVVALLGLVVLYRPSLTR